MRMAMGEDFGHRQAPTRRDVLEVLAAGVGAAATSFIMPSGIAEAAKRVKRRTKHSDLPHLTSDGRKVVFEPGYKFPPILSEFEDKYTARGRVRPVDHGGIDIFAPSGTKIIAPADGKVIISDYSCNSRRRDVVGAVMGNRIAAVFEDGLDRYVGFFGHARKLVAKRGQKIKRGDVLGYVGKTCTPGNHLHWAVYKASGTVRYIPSDKRVRMGIAVNMNPHDVWFGANGSNTVTIPAFDSKKDYSESFGFTYPLAVKRK